MNDCLVHLVSRNAHGTRVDDAAQTDDGDVGRATADVDDHVAVRFRDRQSRAYGRGHRFFDEVNFRSFRAIGGIFDRASLDLRDL